MKHISLSALFLTSAVAGELNIIHLGPPEVIQLEISCDGTTQKMDLPHGGMTGKFILPNEDSTIRVSESEIPILTVEATANSHLAVLSKAAEGYRWSLLSGKPTNNKWALRTINLTDKPIILDRDDEALEIAPDSPTDLNTTGKSGMSVKIKGGESFTYKGSEPCAVVAIIYHKDDSFQVLFVTDR